MRLGSRSLKEFLERAVIMILLGAIGYGLMLMFSKPKMKVFVEGVEAGQNHVITTNRLEEMFIDGKRTKRPMLPLMRNPKPTIDPRMSERDMAIDEAHKARDQSEFTGLIIDEVTSEVPDYENPPDWLVKLRAENGWTNGVRVKP